MGVIDSIRFIRHHPVGRRRTARCLSDWLRWQVGSRLVPGGVVVDWVGDAKLLVLPGMTGATGNVYVGLHEFEEMAFFVHLLRPGDLFVDVGANIGSFSVLASRVAGARTVAFEPHPTTFARLLANVRLNDLATLVDARQRAIGDRDDTIRLTSGLDTVNHVLSGGEELPSVEVRVSRLADELAGEEPAALKIDVEGFESGVIEGSGRVLDDPGLLAIVMELNGSGARYGSRDVDLHRRLLSAGFSSFAYDPFRRSLARQADDRCPNGNGLYVRSAQLAAVTRRLETAPRISVKGLEI